MFKTLRLLATRTIHEYGDDNCSHMAAAISYYVLFSVIPLVIFLVSIFGFIVRNESIQRDVADELVEFLNVEPGVPVIEANEDAIEMAFGAEAVDDVKAALLALSDSKKEENAAKLDDDETVTLAGRTLSKDELTVSSDNIVTDTIEGVSDVSGALTVVGLVGMAWSASAMFGAIRKSLNIAWDTEVHRPVVQQKLVDLGMVLGLGVLLSASLAGTAGVTVLRAISDNLGPVSQQATFISSVVALLLPAAFSFAVFAFVYRYVPNAPSSFRTIWPGVLLATVLFELLKNGFAIYVANFNSYAGAYGALGGLLLFLLWIYLTANILLVGAEVASEYPRVLGGDYDYLDDEPKDDTPLRERVRRTVRGLFVQDDQSESKTDGEAEH